jgi:hypothetical protein
MQLRSVKRPRAICGVEANSVFEKGFFARDERFDFVGRFAKNDGRSYRSSRAVAVKGRMEPRVGLVTRQNPEGLVYVSVAFEVG